MKKYILLSIFGFIIIGFNSCKMASVPIDVLKPAEINIPGDYENITVINRSLAGKGSKGGNFTEGLFSGEGIHQDRDASFNCVIGFADAVNEAPKYKVNFSEDFELYGLGSDKWPIPLQWDTIKQITDYYNTDILIALETFDSDTRNWSKNRVDDDGTEYYEGLEVIITAGWRIYDPYKKIIIDQNSFIDRKVWEKHSDSQSSARRNLPTKREAVNEGGAYAGYMYATRISPTWATENRVYFRKGNDQMKQAHLYIRKNNWKNAYELWSDACNDENSKTAAYANHNLAVYYEFKDDINKALEYAYKANELYPNNFTHTYINILTARQVEINRLNQQLND